MSKQKHRKVLSRFFLSTFGVVLRIIRSKSSLQSPSNRREKPTTLGSLARRSFSTQTQYGLLFCAPGCLGCLAHILLPNSPEQPRNSDINHHRWGTRVTAGCQEKSRQASTLCCLLRWRHGKPGDFSPVEGMV